MIESPFRQPIVSVRHVREVTGLEYAAAKNPVAEFEELRILEEITGQKRSRRFQYRADVSLFDAEGPHDPREGDPAP
ncbi:hypothetical protein [Phycisphaera mikurensis]|uniref:Uncharacterized protein n=1 Tax=Phycisphaera mikurensis (strain NBRC 102666 / KCTC 22515 / FYK2301M01) TaxID=1142394 RepID=I0IAF4_PHYMF|nr:hypothetical protein [Phycisphaera mikurensis]MBB6441761.1 hypothetical protein [Phycisphaera mikurensis]BAM02242.1 hypothetical protein PSMK_00830 [Phycisphaera mikurensis NBRC 102666]